MEVRTGLKTITTVEELQAIYGEPGERSLLKEVPALTRGYRAFVEAAPFVVMATSGAEGLDCSPKGDAPGFVRSAGAPVESTLQDAAWLHFTEFVPAAQPRQRLFVVPVDLSAPPRLLADVPSGECGTPLRAAGGRFWVPAPVGEDTVRALMTE